MSRRYDARLIDTAERLLLAQVAANGISAEQQQSVQIKLAFSLAEKFIAECEQRELAAEAASR